MFQILHNCTSTRNFTPPSNLRNFLDSVDVLLKRTAEVVFLGQFGLYFYDVLSKQAPAGDMKTLLSKATFDFYGK